VEAGGSVTIVFASIDDVVSTTYRYMSGTHFRYHDHMLSARGTPAGHIAVGGQFGRLLFGQSCGP
jgi:hypothetical protein